MTDTRQDIKNLLISSLELEIRRGCKLDKLTNSQTNDSVNRLKEKRYFETRAEEIISEFETNYLDKVFEKFVRESPNTPSLDEVLFKDLLSKENEGLILSLQILNEDLKSLMASTQSRHVLTFEEEIKHLELKIQVLQQQKRIFDQIANSKANRINLYFLGASIVSICGWTILIRRYTWDVMEPWTYLFGGLLVVFNCIYFLFQKTTFSQSEIKKRVLERQKELLYSLHLFSDDHLEHYKEAIEMRRSELGKFLRRK